MDWLAALLDDLKKALEQYKMAIWVVALGLLAARFVREYAKSVRLLSKFHQHDRLGSFLTVHGMILGAWVRSIDILDPKSIIGWSLYDVVRKRTEHEVFHPFSSKKDDKLYDVRAALNSKRPMVTVSTPQVIADAEERILNYFTIVRKSLGPLDLLPPTLILGAAALLLGYVTFWTGGVWSLSAAAIEWVWFPVVVLMIVAFALLVLLVLTTVSTLLGHAARKAKPKTFISGITVQDAFIAPLHLVAGLLNRVGDEWNDIIDVYNDDLKSEGDIAAGKGRAIWRRAAKDIRAVQKFTFDCWLLWGPSIPICGKDCPQHKAPHISIQLGYGDENSSLEIIGKHAQIEELVESLAPEREGGELAVNVKATGWISHSECYSREEKVEMSNTIRDSWRSDDNGRTLLLLAKGDREGSIEPASDPSRYYTAYLWICFVMLRERDGEWAPVYAGVKDEDAASPALEDDVSSKPWLDLIPFFEHANIADAKAYRFLKRQLVRKSLGGLSRFVEDWKRDHPGEAYPLRFAYACAVDDSGCGNELKFSVADNDDDMRNMIDEMVAGGEYANLTDVLEMGHYQSDGNPYSSCKLPRAVGKYLQRVRPIEGGGDA